MVDDGETLLKILSSLLESVLSSKVGNPLMDIPCAYTCFQLRRRKPNKKIMKKYLLLYHDYFLIDSRPQTRRLSLSLRHPLWPVSSENGRMSGGDLKRTHSLNIVFHSLQIIPPVKAATAAHLYSLLCASALPHTHFDFTLSCRRAPGLFLLFSTFYWSVIFTQESLHIINVQLLSFHKVNTPTPTPPSPGNFEYHRLGS